MCGALIGSESLEWERTQLWALTFKLIRKIIGGVDYKVFLSQAQTSDIHWLTTITFSISLYQLIVSFFFFFRALETS